MATSEQPFPSAPGVPWVLRPFGRSITPVLIGGVCLLISTALPHETRIILSLDLLLLTFVTLIYALMSIATAQQCANLAARARLIEKRGVLLATVLASVVSIIAIGAMLNSQRDHARWLKTLHLGASLLALLLGWIAAQMIFGIEYMRLYYNYLQKSAGVHLERDLNFPGQPAPVLWDFMYYSFTIAMCFGTTDVSISGNETRRLTLLHAVYSFFFVAAIVGFVVSVLSNEA